MQCTPVIVSPKMRNREGNARPAGILSWGASLERRAGGAMRVEARTPLGPYPDRLTDCLDFWAERHPDRTFLAQRTNDRPWQHVPYGSFRRMARAAAHWMVQAGAGAERPLAVLSGNEIEHAVLGIGAMYAGIPYAPVSPSYSLACSDLGRLHRILELLTPGVVFASDGAEFGRALEAAAGWNTALVVARNAPRGRKVARFEQIVSGTDGALPQAPSVDDVAKVMFTSGSTGVPKGVITTHRMLASNQEMLRTVFPFFADEPPVICDWLPWHHTFGGSHNVGLVLYNGGTMYLDAGRPVEGQFAQTIENLREIAPTAYFNVPKGYEMLAAALRGDSELRGCFFSRLRMMFYAGAGLSQNVWNELQQMALQTVGARVPMLTGLGATETAPFAMCTAASNERSSAVGLPVPGVTLKLAPSGGKLEARFRGPNVTPGYWRQPEPTAAAFDDEGFYKLGDALRFVDEADVDRGFLFDGRLAEDFKLSTGTWVSVGPLRARFLAHCAPYARDVVIAGHDRNEVVGLIFPDPEEYARLESNGGARAAFERLIASFAEENPGSSTRIERVIVLQDQPSLDEGELTDKGTVSQRRALERRAAMVARLYATPVGDDVICAASKNVSRAHD